MDPDPVRVERRHERSRPHVEERHRHRHRQHDESEHEPADGPDLRAPLDEDQVREHGERGEHRGVLVEVPPRHPVRGEAAGHDRHDLSGERDPRHGACHPPDDVLAERQVVEVADHRTHVAEQRHVERVVGDAGPLHGVHPVPTRSLPSRSDPSAPCCARRSPSSARDSPASTSRARSAGAVSASSCWRAAGSSSIPRSRSSRA